MHSFRETPPHLTTASQSNPPAATTSQHQVQSLLVTSTSASSAVRRSTASDSHQVGKFTLNLPVHHLTQHIQPDSSSQAIGHPSFDANRTENACNEQLPSSSSFHPPRTNNVQNTTSNSTLGDEQQATNNSDPPWRSLILQGSNRSQAQGRSRNPQLNLSFAAPTPVNVSVNQTPFWDSPDLAGPVTPPVASAPVHSPLRQQLFYPNTLASSPPRNTASPVRNLSPKPLQLLSSTAASHSNHVVERLTSSPRPRIGSPAARSISPVVRRTLASGETILSPRWLSMDTMRSSPNTEIPNPLSPPPLMNRGMPLTVDENDLQMAESSNIRSHESNSLLSSANSTDVDEVIEIMPHPDPIADLSATSPPTPFPTTSSNPSSASPPPSNQRPPPNLRISVPERTDEPMAIPPDTEDDMVMVEREHTMPTDEENEALFLDDEGLTSLEKIYLFSKSQFGFHRTFISKQLPILLQDVQPQEAVDYVLPLLNSLGTDEDETVKEVFVNELIPIIWWFFTHCQIIEQDQLALQQEEGVPLLYVNTFTPLIGSLLLSANPRVGDCARLGLVELLNRLNNPPTEESDSRYCPSSTRVSFGEREKGLIENEIMYGVVIGMARLDAEYNYTENADISAQLQDTSVDYSIPDISRIVGAPSPEPQPQPDSQQNTPNNRYMYPPPVSPPARVVAVRSDESGIPSIILDSPTSRVPQIDQDGWVTMGPGPGVPIDDDTSPGASTPIASAPTSIPSRDTTDWITDDTNLDDASGEATVGRVASMSLVAALAANAKMSTQMQDVFVNEVDRVGRDPVYWVRREASFAVGALAKVVPAELVISTLLPLYESLVNDLEWHVRHSILFALPGLLARLEPPNRRTLAVQSLTKLCSDPSDTVRSALLEVLGEVIYTFKDDPGGPPRELLDLFVPEETYWGSTLHDDASSDFFDSESSVDIPVRSMLFGQERPPSAIAHQLESPPRPRDERATFFQDPERPIVCAFNYPAIVLTLGAERWPEIRKYYLHLAEDRTVKVRRTLAASLGEVATIIGAEQAGEDLLPVFWDAIKAEDSDIRSKVLECLPKFLSALDIPHREAVATGLVTLWDTVLRDWREREVLSSYAGSLTKLFGSRQDVVKEIMDRALRNEIAAVRDAAILNVPAYLEGMGQQSASAREAIFQLSTADNYRRRATFVACLQEMFMANQNESNIHQPDAWNLLRELIKDRVSNVRIAVARLVARICETYYPNQRSRPKSITEMVQIIARDESLQVRSFVDFLLRDETATPVPSSDSAYHIFATFSKPPHPPSSGHLTPPPPDTEMPSTTQTLTYDYDPDDDTLPTPPMWGQFSAATATDESSSAQSMEDDDGDSSSGAHSDSNEVLTPDEQQDSDITPDFNLENDQHSMQIVLPAPDIELTASSTVQTPVPPKTPRPLVSPAVFSAVTCPLPESPMASPYGHPGMRDEEPADYFLAGNRRRRAQRLSSDSAISVASG